MVSRYRALSLYSFLLACAGGVALWVAMRDGVEFPPYWAVGLCVGACIFVFHFGVPAPRVGLISMERVPQIGMVLVLDPTAAAAIAAIASLLWPLINRRYSQGSSTVGLLRGAHNAGMTALMLLVGAWVYRTLGGHEPLMLLNRTDVAPLIAMAMVMQAINIASMTVFFGFDGRSVRQIITPSYALSDLVFVPAGVLAALLFNLDRPGLFALFVGVMAILVLSFHTLGQASAANKRESSPLARMFRTRRALHGARSLDELGTRVVAELHALLRFDRFTLAVREPQRPDLDVRVREYGGVRLPATRSAVGTDILGWVGAKSQPVLIRDWNSTAPEWRECASTAERELPSLLAVPLAPEQGTMGVVCLQHSRPGAYTAADLHLLRRLADEIAVAVADARAFEDAEQYRLGLERCVAERTAELEQANRDKERLIAVLRERSLELERETQEDPLTGVANRRCFLQRATAEIEVAAAVGHPLTLAIADLDHFKVINDRLGHPVGDEVLRQSAQLMREICRPSDLLARIGGEEFALLMPATDLAGALRLCERLRQTVASFDWSAVSAETKVTVSIGLWQWDGAAALSQLLHGADTQLYEAKRGGRNRVA